MLPTNPICAVCDYGTSAVYRDLPSEEQRRSGVVPLDSLPAAWWNCMWYDINRSMNQARNAVGSLINELDTVLTQAGICACDTCVNQLYQAIEVLRRTIGDSTTPGAVKSSSTPGQVSIDNNGIMTANCVGNANNLNTTAHTLVGAINELKQVYDCCISDLKTCDTTLNNNKAPNNHASAATTYGVGNASNYGHVRLSDTYNTCVGAAADGIAASQKAVYDMYTAITSAGYVCLGNTAGCALGTASAGSASTAARSDHVHPISCSISDTSGIGLKVEYGNEANFGVASGLDTLFINWRGGVSTVKIMNGNAVGADSYGNLYAANFYGCLNGNASTATTAGSATVASCASYVNRYAYCDDFTFNVALFDGDTSNPGAQLYVSCVNHLRFNAASGILFGTCFTGNAVTATYATCATRADNAGVAEYVASGNTGISVDYANDFTGLRWAMYSDQNFPGQYGNLIQMQTDTGPSTRWGYQLFFATNDNIYYRTWVNSTEMSTWKCIITSDNIGSQTAANASYATYACYTCNNHYTPAVCGDAVSKTFQSKSFYWPAGTTYERVWNDLAAFLPLRACDTFGLQWGWAQCGNSASCPVTCVDTISVEPNGTELWITGSNVGRVQNINCTVGWATTGMHIGITATKPV